MTVTNKTSRLQTVPMEGFIRPEMKTRVRISINMDRREPVQHGRIFWLVYDNTVIAEGRDAHPETILTWIPQRSLPIENRLNAFAKLVMKETFRKELPALTPADMADHPKAGLKNHVELFLNIIEGDPRSFEPALRSAEALKSEFLNVILGTLIFDGNRTVEWLTKAVFYIHRSGIADARPIFDLLMSFMADHALFMSDRLMWENATLVTNGMPREYNLPKVRPTDMFRLTAYQIEDLIARFRDISGATEMIDRMTSQRETERVKEAIRQQQRQQRGIVPRDRVPLSERLHEPYLLGRRIYLPSGHRVAYISNPDFAQDILAAVREWYARQMRNGGLQVGQTPTQTDNDILDGLA